MRITPLDVRKQEFRKGMRGLDAEEVYAFLATVADEYELLLNDNKALRERLLELDDKVQEYRSMEKTLRDTLLTAERVNVEAKDNARREATIIIKEAQIEAEKALRDIKSEAMKLRAQVQQLRAQRDSFLARMKVVAESHLSYIRSAVDDFQREDSDVDVDLATEHLADRPVEAEERVVRRTPPPAAPEPERHRPEHQRSEHQRSEHQRSEHVEPERVTATPERVQTTPPQRAATPTGRAAGDRVPTPATPGAPREAQASPRPEPAAPPRLRATGPGEAAAAEDGPDPITVIIDRMKRGQQEVLSSGAGAPDLPEAAAPGQGTVFGRKATAPAEAGATNDDTRELRLDDIRREIGIEENVER